jgi:hypothetical protein
MRRASRLAQLIPSSATCSAKLERLRRGGRGGIGGADPAGNEQAPPGGRELADQTCKIPRCRSGIACPQSPASMSLALEAFTRLFASTIVSCRAGPDARPTFLAKIHQPPQADCIANPFIAMNPRGQQHVFADTRAEEIWRATRSDPAQWALGMQVACDQRENLA